MWSFFKRLIGSVLLGVIVLVTIFFGNDLYTRFFSANNVRWISERFSEELKEKNELVVLETILTGQETACIDAWLVGTVQEVQVPYTYSISFSVDLSQSEVQSVDNTIEVTLPPPRAVFSKLTVDESGLKKSDWLYPLTPERYADITQEIEKKLYDECVKNAAFMQSARATAVESMEALFVSFAENLDTNIAKDIRVVLNDSATYVSTAGDSLEPLGMEAVTLGSAG